VRLLLAILSLIFFGCSLRDGTPPKKPAQSLRLLSEYRLAIPEPSGLSLGSGGASLWTVSDRTGRVYRISLTGTVLQELPFAGTDLEGVAFDSLRHCLWVTEEKTREIVKLNLQGREIQHRHILEGSDNSGLEGICVDSQGTLFTLKEKNPGLFIRLKPDFSVDQKWRLNFAPDFSGICADTSRGKFWIVSDQGRKLFLWSPEGGVFEQFSLSFPKAEGVAWDFVRHRLYIVSDSEQKLFVFLLEEN